MKNKKRTLQVIVVLMIISIGLLSNYHSFVSSTVKSYTYSNIQKVDSAGTSSGRSEFFIYTKKIIESGINHLISNL